MKEALQKEGWYLSDEGINNLYEQLGRTDASLNELITAALDVNLLLYNY